jgi:Flp pilus assembly protein TadG
MLGSIRRTLRRLKRSTSGNATLLVALGLPVLIGGSGLAVDTAQWYMWKRELQNAADQAALAGAWARSNADTESSYVTRARQEYAANIATVTDFDTVPEVELADWNGGSLNSVIVTATASKTLPFSSLFVPEAVTVSVYAKASFDEGSEYTACLIATDEDDSGAITIGGDTTLTAKCGLAALSTSDSSIVINGNPTLDPGWVVSAGGIDDWLSQHTDAEIHEYIDGLSDPFAGLTTPTPSPNEAKTYECVAGKTTTTATTSAYTETWEYVYSGPQRTKLSLESQTKIATGDTTTEQNVTVPNGTVEGLVTTTSTSRGSIEGHNGQYTRTDTVYITYTTYSNVIVTVSQTQATLTQGTYTGGFDVSCTTVLLSGIYVIDGGRVKITGQYDVTGSGIMFVLKNGAYIDIQGGSNINLTAASASQLEAAGLTAEQAGKFDGMLVFEDRESPGSDNSTINGTADTVLNGKIYLPKSSFTFSGTAQVTTACLLIAAKNITLTGTTNMTSFCPDGGEITDTVGGTSATVRLVE